MCMWHKHNGNTQGVLRHKWLLQLQQGSNLLQDWKTWQLGSELDRRCLLQLPCLFELGWDHPLHIAN